MQQRVLELIERVANEEVVGEWSDGISTVAGHVDVNTHLYPLKEFFKIPNIFLHKKKLSNEHAKR